MTTVFGFIDLVLTGLTGQNMIKEYRDFPDELSEEDAKSFLKEIAEQRKLAKQRYYSSLLDPHKAAIFRLKHAGGTPSDIQKYLHRKLDIKVVLTTVIRWLKKHDEEYKRTFSDGQL